MSEKHNCPHCNSNAEQIKKDECHCDSEQTKVKEHSCHCSEDKQVKQHSCCGGEDKRVKQHSCCGGESKNANKINAGGCCGTIKSKNKWVSWVILGVSLASLIVSFISPFHNNEILRWFDFGYIAVILCGIPIFIAAVQSLKKGKISSSLLISISILACITLEVLMLTKVLPSDGHGHGNIFAAGEVAFLMAIGGKIEEFTVSKARAGIQRLVSLTPQVAKYRVGDSIISKPLSEVRKGDEVIVLAGDVISVDGEIISGDTAVDQSIMTGESVPIDKSVGDKVYGGTLNTSGTITVRVNKTADEMAVTKLKNLVEEAEGKKAPISKIADKWAGIIVPAAVGFSILVFLFSYFVLGSSMGANRLSESILRGVTMLVVFCPCALALATPTAIAAGLGAAARRGILIKSAGALESLAKVKNIAFDKTGTLTHGQLKVGNVFSLGENTSHLEAITGACERFSNHPVAKAVYEYCKTKAELPECEGAKALVGSGVEGIVFGKKIKVVKFSEAENYSGITTEIKTLADSYIAQGKTVIATIEDGKFIGFFSLSDTVKANAKDTVSALSELGINSVMLTGDNEKSAKLIAQDTGINYQANLLPEDKLKAIETLKGGGLVGMVGDGVNDAPALAAADVSFAMAALGSDTAIETADISVLDSNIQKVAHLTKFSRRVLFTIKINIIISLMISFASVFLSAFGVLNPVTGALVHNLSSILVVSHSALLLFWGKSKKSSDKNIQP